MSTLAQVAGRNARAIRLDAGVQLQDLAKALRNYGMHWATGTVGNFESGRMGQSTLATLLAVTGALSDVIGDQVTLADLFAGAEPVQINNELSTPLPAVHAALAGERFVPPQRINGSGITANFVETDELMCKKLGMPNEAGAEAMFKLWGRTFRAERDRRAGPRANHAHRGQITRQLQADLMAYIAEHRILSSWVVEEQA